MPGTTQPHRRAAGPLAALTLAAALTLMPPAMRPASAEVSQAEAIAVVAELYATHAALTGTGQPGAVASRTMRQRFFGGPDAAMLPELARRLHPLTGTGEAAVSDFSIGAPQKADGAVTVPVTVTAGGRRTVLSVTVAGTPEGPKVVDIASGQGDERWSMRNMLAVLARLAPPADTAAAPGTDRAAPTGSAAEGSETVATRQEAAPAGAARPAAEATAPAPQETAPRETAAADPAAEAPGRAPAPAPADAPYADGFDGTTLARAWTRVAPNDERMLVDDGALVWLATGGPFFSEEEPVNLLKLDTATPQGDFELSVDLKLESNTGWDAVWLGVRESHRDWVAAMLFVGSSGCGKSIRLRIRNMRDLDPERDPTVTQYTDNLFDGGPIVDRICGNKGRRYGDAVLEALASEGARLTLQKRGFLYRARLEMTLPPGEDRAGGPLTTTTRAVSRFAPVGPPALLVGQMRERRGETFALIDEFAFDPAR